MAGVPDTLREIHRLRRHARDLQSELDRGPIQVKARRAVAAKAADAFKQAQDDLKKLKVKTHENEVTFKTTTQQIEKYERQKSEAGEAKQILAFEHQIATARAKADTLETETLEAYSAIEEKTADLPNVETAAKKAQDDLAAWEAQHTERTTRLAGELKEALSAVSAREAELPDDMVAQYKRMVNAFGADAFAAAEGHNCSHCHTQITQQQLLDIGCGLFVTCRSCGRGLYTAS